MASFQKELRIGLSELLSQIEVTCLKCKTSVMLDLDSSFTLECRVLVCPVCSSLDLNRNPSESIIDGTEQLVQTLRALKGSKCEVSFKASIKEDSAGFHVDKTGTI